MHCKAGHLLRDLFGTNQENVSDTTFVAGATKINLKNLKTWLWLKAGEIQAAIWRYQFNRRFEPLANSGKSLYLSF